MIRDNVQPVVLMFRLGLTGEERAAILQSLTAWAEIADARPLVPQSIHPRLERLAYVYVVEGADIATVCERLSAVEQIESASIPSARQLA